MAGKRGGRRYLKVAASEECDVKGRRNRWGERRVGGLFHMEFLGMMRDLCGARWRLRIRGGEGRSGFRLRGGEIARCGGEEWGGFGCGGNRKRGLK